MTAENKDKGFIKIYRSINEWDWWDDMNTFRLFMTILILANWKDKKWRGKKIKRGQLWTSLSTLSDESGLSIKQVRNSLDKLIKTNEVTSERANNGRLITVVNYEFYQDNDENGANERANDKADRGQTKGKRGATTKERKEVKELKDVVVVVPKTSKEFWSLLSDDELDSLSKIYPRSYAFLIDAVAEEVVQSRRKIKSPYSYIVGFARRSKWNDDADHFSEVQRWTETD